jgi:hypothetical protein
VALRAGRRLRIEPTLSGAGRMISVVGRGGRFAGNQRALKTVGKVAKGDGNRLGCCVTHDFCQLGTDNITLGLLPLCL